MKRLLWDLANIGLDGHAPWRWLKNVIPSQWGYRGPTEASYRVRPTNWLSRLLGL